MRFHRRDDLYRMHPVTFLRRGPATEKCDFVGQRQKIVSMPVLVCSSRSASATENREIRRCRAPFEQVNLPWAATEFCDYVACVTKDERVTEFCRNERCNSVGRLGRVDRVGGGVSHFLTCDNFNYRKLGLGSEKPYFVRQNSKSTIFSVMSSSMYQIS